MSEREVGLNNQLQILGGTKISTLVGFLILILQMLVAPSPLSSNHILKRDLSSGCYSLSSLLDQLLALSFNLICLGNQRSSVLHLLEVLGI